MKNIYVIMFAACWFLLSIYACLKDERPEIKSVSAGYKIVEIDGCEYIESHFNGQVEGNILVHKANCKNHKN